MATANERDAEAVEVFRRALQGGYFDGAWDIDSADAVRERAIDLLGDEDLADHCLRVILGVRF